LNQHEAVGEKQDKDLTDIGEQLQHRFGIGDDILSTVYLKKNPVFLHFLLELGYGLYTITEDKISISPR
jgi:hypothetical protein